MGSRLGDEVRGLDSSMIVIDIMFIRIALDRADELWSCIWFLHWGVLLHMVSWVFYAFLWSVPMRHENESLCVPQSCLKYGLEWGYGFVLHKYKDIECFHSIAFCMTFCCNLFRKYEAIMYCPLRQLVCQCRMVSESTKYHLDWPTWRGCDVIHGHKMWPDWPQVSFVLFLFTVHVVHIVSCARIVLLPVKTAEKWTFYNSQSNLPYDKFAQEAMALTNMFS